MTLDVVYVEDAGRAIVEVYVSGRVVAEVPAVRRADASPGDADAVAVETAADLVGRVLYVLGHREAYPS
ncbi:hypothetical protein [Pseudonocardia sp. D17]|uniref:hypothetical protein n=1 Tax=Pseudonocardia sp. D17 TaxID=882661 RepID=UPI0030CC7B56